MSTTTQLQIRLRVDIDFPALAPLDVLRCAHAVFTLGSACRLELGFFKRGILLTAAEIDELAASDLIVQIKAQRTGSAGGAPAASSAALAGKTVLGASLDNTVTADTWADGTAQHAVAEFSEADMSFTFPSKGRAWLIIAGARTLSAAACEVVEDGYASSGDIVPPASKIAFASRPDITAETGGTATDLDGQPTIGAGGYAVGSILVLSIDDTSHQWKLKTSSATPAAGYCVQPVDNSAVRWVLIS